ncbi:Flagellar biosynthesis protein FliO [Imhoffiella purpurea]|uniref:Flagellar protein n=1 Tax=Imhoffiella purpurea TaxID=1249627 RepID=W9VBC4_9GAMM|nr:Flagellar biosynthesis protein FliO [Imhoffiella purpurea]
MFADPQTGGAHAPATYLTQLIGSLALIVLAILVLAWLLKRFSAGGMQGRQMIEVLAVKPLGMRERLMLVQVGEDQILLAMTPAGIRHVHTLSRPIEPLDPGVRSQPVALDFASLLRRFGGKEQ